MALAAFTAGVEGVADGDALLHQTLGSVHLQPGGVGFGRDGNVGLYRNDILSGFIIDIQGIYVQEDAVHLGLGELDRFGLAAGLDGDQRLAGRIVLVGQDAEFHDGVTAAAQFGSHHPLFGNFHLPGAVGFDTQLFHTGVIGNDQLGGINLQLGRHLLFSYYWLFTVFK